MRALAELAKLQGEHGRLAEIERLPERLSTFGGLPPLIGRVTPVD